MNSPTHNAAKWPVLLAVVAILAAGAPARAQPGGTTAGPAASRPASQPASRPATNVPSVGEVISLVDKATSGPGGKGDWAAPIKLAVVFTIMALLPSILIMMTAFCRIVIVLAFVRRALTTQSIPPTLAIIGLALFLTLFTMAPTFEKIQEKAIAPYMADTINFGQAVSAANDQLKEFMFRQTHKNDLAMFLDMGQVPAPRTVEDIPAHVLIPAFSISEFRTAFEMGVLLFVPFLLIDLVISGILLSAGMMMLPPAMISLPFEIVLFVLADGWRILAKTLVTSFN
ncbi:MAG: flagellar type III secretion system pore protein FliP [Planctomycetota bacterium]|nr:flagellar type III secretion system pore protein FliP [Planctomycetota bacterium]